MLLVCSSAVYAQSNTTKFTMNVSSHHYPKLDILQTGYSNNSALKAGMSYNLTNLNKLHSVCVGLYFAKSNNLTSIVDVYESELSLPITFSYRIMKNISISSGFSYGRSITSINSKKSYNIPDFQNTYALRKLGYSLSTKYHYKRLGIKLGVSGAFNYLDLLPENDLSIYYPGMLEFGISHDILFRKKCKFSAEVG